MIGILVVTHGEFGVCLLKAAESILGVQEQAMALALPPEKSREDLAVEIAAALDKLDQGDGVLVLVDLLGGTPCNASLAFSLRPGREVVTGVSMPVLIEALMGRTRYALEDLAEWVQKKGQEGLVLAGRQARQMAGKGRHDPGADPH